MRPHIGITTSFNDDTQSLPRAYAEAVERAGGVPLLLPMTETSATVDAVVETIDGLVVPGGPAVTEGLTGTLPDALGVLDPLRAASDRRYMEACWDADRPMLGICYGMQRMNALVGGTIYADVERQLDGAQVHSQKRGATSHKVHLRETSRLRRLLRVDTLEVNTRHLQAIDAVGTGFAVAATAPDGVIEAIEHTSAQILGVQFHPERMGETMHPLFRHLVRQAKASRSVSSA
jgi:putative glutamine amidotransferase